MQLLMWSFQWKFTASLTLFLHTLEVQAVVFVVGDELEIVILCRPHVGHVWNH